MGSSSFPHRHDDRWSDDIKLAKLEGMKQGSMYSPDRFVRFRVNLVQERQKAPTLAFDLILNQCIGLRAQLVDDDPILGR